MLTQYLGHKFKTLNLLITRSIVVRYHPKRSPFDKTTYNPEWVPRVNPYSKHRKPALKQWTSSEVVGPEFIPPLRKEKDVNTYMKTVIEAEQKKKAECSKQYLVDDIRSGDIVEISYQHTFQNDQLSTYRCFVLSFKRKNSYSAALEVLIRLGGMNIKAIYLIHSPKVKSIKLISKGSGNFRANLNPKWKTMPKTQVQKPLIRNRVMKLRRGEGRRVKKARAGSIVFDRIKSDNVKNII